MPAARHAALAKYRVLVLDGLPDVPADSDTRAAVSNLVDAMAEAGATVSNDTSLLPDVTAIHQIYVKMLNTALSRGTPGARPIDAHEWMELMDEQMRVTRAWRELFETYDVVIAPIFSTPAFPYKTEPDWGNRTLSVDGRMQPYGAQLTWAGLATFPGLPATAVPVAKSGEGLPIGLQLIGGPYEDRTTLGLASLLEEAGLTV